MSLKSEKSHFQRITLSVNETRSCAKLTVCSLAYDIFLYTYVTKPDEIVWACTPIFCRWPPSAKPASSFHIQRKVIRMCHITTEYKEQIGVSLCGVTRVITLVKPLNGKLENILLTQKVIRVKHTDYIATSWLTATFFSSRN